MGRKKGGKSLRSEEKKRISVATKASSKLKEVLPLSEKKKDTCSRRIESREKRVYPKVQKAL